MKKRIRGMTSASRGEKEGKRGWDVDAVEREWQNGASEKRASPRRCGAARGVMERSDEERRRRWAVSRVWQLFRAKDERRRDI